MADELTVEQCLKELREMFPDQTCEVSFRTAGLGFVKVTAWENGAIPKQRHSEFADTLSEAMAQVRAWKEQQS